MCRSWSRTCTARAASEREAVLADPGLRPLLHRPMFVARYRTGEGWYDARLTAYGPLQLDPTMARCTTRSRSSRGSRPTRSPTAASPLSGPRPTRPGSPAAPSDWRCRRCPRSPFSPPSTPCRRRPRLGADGAGPDPVPAAVPDGVGAVPRRAAGPRVPVPRDRQPGRGVLPPRRAPGVGVPLRGLHPGGARRYRRHQVRRQLRGQPPRAGAGDRGRLRPGRLARRGREALRRGDGRDEPVLRPRLRRGRRAGHPRAHRHPAARHHPRLAHHGRRGDGPPGRPSGGSASTSGARAWPTAP